jgi:hypothetical protein
MSFFITSSIFMVRFKRAFLGVCESYLFFSLAARSFRRVASSLHFFIILLQVHSNSTVHPLHKNLVVYGLATGDCNSLIVT